LCGEAADAVRELAARKRIDFAVDLDASAGSVTGDRRRLRQAIDNVLKNAFLYTPDGGRVLLHARGDAAEAEVTISDSGKGISPGDQTRVFDRFHRTAPVRGEDQSALGLGLPLAKQFVEAHGGSVRLQSELGAGTTVTFRLPRAP
jgi:signal transduction histidine kinase